MRAWGSVLVAAALAAQEAPPGGAFRGTLLEWDQAVSGALTVRARDNHVYCFEFDGRTQVEREGRPIPGTELRKGDTIEIVSGPGSSPKRQYARIIRVLASRPVLPPLAAYRLSYRGRYSAMPDLFPRGNLTFAGVVSEVNEDRLVLRTRAQGQTRILLRPDTRYVHDGAQVEPAVLRVNTRVFVRGARNLDDEIEAYQVMWGTILKPEN